MEGAPLQHSLPKKFPDTCREKHLKDSDNMDILILVQNLFL